MFQESGKTPGPKSQGLLLKTYQPAEVLKESLAATPKPGTQKVQLKPLNP